MNKRAAIWGAMRNWLKVGSIPADIPGLDHSLVDELIGPRYGHNVRNEIQLESKEDMRRRADRPPSPDAADALACTFAYSSIIPDERELPLSMMQPMVVPDYNPYELERI